MVTEKRLDASVDQLKVRGTRMWWGCRACDAHQGVVYFNSPEDDAQLMDARIKRFCLAMNSVVDDIVATYPKEFTSLT